MQDVRSVASSTRLIAILTLLSRILGLTREILYGHLFGTSPLLSAFRIAFMIPNLARRLFGEGALSAAFIPVFTRFLARNDRNASRRLAGSVLTLLGLILVGIVLLIETGVFVGNQVHPSAIWSLTAVMLPFMAFICAAAFLGAILNTMGHFAAPAASPIVLNIFVIVSLLVTGMFFTDDHKTLVYVAAVAVLFAGIAQMSLQWFALHAHRMTPIMATDWKLPEIREIGRFMTPMLLGLSTVQLNTLMDLLIAWWFVPDGKGPAVLGFAHFLYQLPLGVFGIALATAIFPVLSAQAVRNDLAAVSHTLLTGLRLSFFIMLPATVGLILIASPLVSVMFEHGEFGPESTNRVARTLSMYALGLCAYSAQHLLVRVYYSLKDSATPARISASVVLVNLALNLVLVRYFREAGVGMATAFSACLQVILLARGLRGKVPRLDAQAFRSSLLKTVLATIAMGIVVWVAMGMLPDATSRYWAGIRVALAVTLGGGTVAVAARLLRAPELSEFLHRRS